MQNRYAICSIVCFLIACKDLPVSDRTTAADKQMISKDEGEPYTIDTAASKVYWVGTKFNGSQKGSICLSAGSLGLMKGEVKSGQFTMSIATLENVGLQAKDKNKIENHLKSADFFNVKRYPFAYFVITRVERFDEKKIKSVIKGATHVISGNLTLKGVTKNVTFPARIILRNNVLNATANFLINRNDWGMNYKGANNPQNWLISNQVNVKLNIVARK